MVDKLFTQQTKGIIRRNRVFKESWGPHLVSSKKISSLHIEPWLSSGKTITILGAGQLLDFPISLYNKFSEQITLVDRSSLALRSYSRKTVNYDVTGSLGTWLEYIQNLKPSGPKDFLANIETITTTFPLLLEPCFRDMLVISLNILSQIPVYWQNAIFDIFSKQFPKEPAKDWENKILNALQPSSRALIKSHLKALVPRGRHKESILITDTHYLDYRSPVSNILSASPFKIESDLKTIQDLDLEIKENAKEIKIESMDALFGVSIVEELGAECEIQFLDKWQWDILPFNSENKSVGTSHRVVALKIT